MGNFVAGMNDAGMIAATQETANVLEGKFEFGEKKVGGDVAGGNQIFSTGGATKIAGFKVEKFGADGNKVAGSDR